MGWRPADPGPDETLEKAVGEQPSSFLAGRAQRSGPGRDAWGLFVLSAGVLGYELLLMRVFSVLMWYHLASLAIALALLGLGTGGVLAGLWPGLRRDPWPARGAVAFGAGVLGFLGFLAAVRADPDLARTTLAPFHQPFYQPFAQAGAARPGWELAVRLAGLAVLAGLPFLGAGVSTAGVLARHGPGLHRAYAAVFLGSAAGAAGAPVVLAFVSAPAALGLSAAVGFSATALLGGRRLGRAGLALAVLAVFITTWAQATGGAEVPLARGQYQKDLLAVRWSPVGRVAAYLLPPGDRTRPFGLSRTYRGPVPAQVGLVVDDSGYTNLFEGSAARGNPDYFRANLVALAWHLRPGARSLLVGPGGGKDLWVALSFPRGRVHAVEINPQVVEMVQEVFGQFTGRPYAEPAVTLTVADARGVVARDPDRYDVIEASAVFGRLPPAAGAFSLSEDLLHTRESFRAYWDHLTARGILSVTLFAYENRALRLAALARDLLDRAGVARPADHVRVVADRGLANLLVSRAPFGPDDDRLRALVSRYRFRFLYPPPDGPTTLSRLLDGRSLERELARTEADLAPPTDDRPFFYYTLRPRDLLGGGSAGRDGFDNRGARILQAALAVVGGLTLLGLLVPPALAGKGPGPVAPAALVYAGLLGAGYMLLEIGVLKRFTLFLGHPVYAASATLCGFLLGSGLGAAWAARWTPSRSRLLAVLAAAVVLGLGMAVGVPRWVPAFPDWPTAVRWATAAGVVFPLAFALGIPFPAGVALLGPAAGSTLPWLWAVNGAASVLGSLAAVLVAMTWGYTATLLAGTAAYLVAAAWVPALGKGKIRCADR